MRIEFDFKDQDVAIMRLQGRFVTGVDIAYLKSKTEELKATGRHRIIVDFSEVPYIDSTGLAFIVSAYTTFSKDGGKLVLARPSARVREVLQLTRLAGIIPCEDDEAKALVAVRS